MKHCPLARQLFVPGILALAVFAGSAQAAAPLRPPQGFLAPVDKVKEGNSGKGCAAVPTPYTQSLQFRSKYEGSDKSRSTLNPEADKAFRSATHDINDMEKGTSKLVMDYMRDGRADELDCTLSWLTTWAKADALMSKDFNHTGKSIRKWTLASLSSAYLHLKFSASHPLVGHEQDAQVIEAWFGRLADQVVSEWDNLPLDKTNNHSYWAAWSVMSTAVVLNRRDLFDWSVKEFKIGADQVDPQGYWPNELKRDQRALAYHAYAMQPMAMIASFAQANGVDLRAENNSALLRVGQRVVAGAKDPSIFQKVNGSEQDMSELETTSKWSWLEPWCSLYNCDGDALARKREGEPFKTFRLGGDVTKVFDPAHEKGNG
ncbi:mannuronate-specific alginate lyase [Pseudomonas sp. dw_358]|uniref:mannuronate-specific alginate lyase n=1 Tax=Pseudomonas sp. dw_358 TaxID=2720083 RepID=UPI001BD4EB3C|nr:mannuronate-specific alginate lyase [Pseudomonas sp. dw_358]